MSLYREAGGGRRRRRLVLGASLVVAAAAALVLVLVLRDGSSPEERLAGLQEDVQPALAALELVPIHYESPAPATHAAAADQLAVARDTVAEQEDELRALDAAATAELTTELETLDRLVGTTGQADAVEQGSAEAARTLRRLVRLPASGDG